MALPLARETFPVELGVGFCFCPAPGFLPVRPRESKAERCQGKRRGMVRATRSLAP
ncbi:protein of unknown function [Paraburkholderia kururiensis]